MTCENCLHYCACLVNSEYLPSPCRAYEDNADHSNPINGAWKEKFFDALGSIIWYDGHCEWLKTIRDEMETILKTGDKYANYICPFDYAEWHTEQHTIFMILVGMFGDWGTSIRGGWIDDMEGCIEFIDVICKEYLTRDEMDKEGGE